MEIVAGRVALQRDEMRAAVVGAQHDRVHHVHAIGVLRIDRDATEIPAALPDAIVAADALPARTGIVRAVEAADVVLDREAVDDRVDTLRVARRHGNADTADPLRKTVRAERRPGVAAVGRLVKRAAGPVRGRIDVPRRAPRLPHRRVDRLRVAGLERKVDRAGRVVVAEHALPRCAAVARAEHAAFGVRSVRMTERRDEHRVRIGGIDDDPADLLAVVEADARPRMAAVARAVHAGALRDVRAHVGFARADVNDVRRRRRDGDRADRADRLLIEDRLPRAPRVGGFPDAAVDRAEIEMLRLVRHAGDREHAAAAKRADQPPRKIVVETGVNVGAGDIGVDCAGEKQCECARDTDAAWERSHGDFPDQEKRHFTRACARCAAQARDC